MLQPMEFMARLVALVPPPRAHLTRYHGALAPNVRLRPLVVLKPKPKVDEKAPKPATPPPPRRLNWATLLKRVFAIDVLQCPKCPGRMEVLAHVTEPAIVKRILAHLKLPTEPPSRGPASRMIEEVDPWPERDLGSEPTVPIDPDYEDDYEDPRRSPGPEAPIPALNSRSRPDAGGGESIPQRPDGGIEAGREAARWRRSPHEAQAPPEWEESQARDEREGELADGQRARHDEGTS